MTFEGDDESVDIPVEMFDEDEKAVLAPVFQGNRMEAEIIRSLLDSNGIPAVVFGTGGYAFGAEDVGPNERVMVRASDVETALQTIASTDLSEEGLIEPDADDIEVMVEDDYDETSAEPGYWDEEEADPADVPVLASGSDWGTRIVGLVGVAAIAVTIIVIVSKAT